MASCRVSLIIELYMCCAHNLLLQLPMVSSSRYVEPDLDYLIPKTLDLGSSLDIAFLLPFSPDLCPRSFHH